MRLAASSLVGEKNHSTVPTLGRNCKRKLPSYGVCRHASLGFAGFENSYPFRDTSAQFFTFLDIGYGYIENVSSLSKLSWGKNRRNHWNIILSAWCFISDTAEDGAPSVMSTSGTSAFTYFATQLLYSSCFLSKGRKRSFYVHTFQLLPYIPNWILQFFAI